MEERAVELEEGLSWSPLVHATPRGSSSNLRMGRSRTIAFIIKNYPGISESHNSNPWCSRINCIPKNIFRNE